MKKMPQETLDLKSLREQIQSKADPVKAASSKRFFKTGPGQYGEGDQFLGITVPEARKLAKASKDLSLNELKTLLNSPLHEERFIALEILVMQYEAAPRRELVDFYRSQMPRINNWDLVDTSAPYLWGAWVLAHPEDEPELRALLQSKNLWERRIAMVATLAFIRGGNLKWPLDYAKVLLNDTHDLMHKAVGWMLRELGKKDEALLEKFLDEHATQLPRTALRYAIERLSFEQRTHYLHLK